mmetsp:Transcript_25880/g.103444  ORF Transcript_25880/g.103444 Transcript_25880/m.103444 type:complete len:629 (-) Transcript_25880:11-1897(-)
MNPRLNSMNVTPGLLRDECLITHTHGLVLSLGLEVGIPEVDHPQHPRDAPRVVLVRLDDGRDVDVAHEAREVRGVQAGDLDGPALLAEHQCEHQVVRRVRVDELARDQAGRAAPPLALGARGRRAAQWRAEQHGVLDEPGDPRALLVLRRLARGRPADLELDRRRDGVVVVGARAGLPQRGELDDGFARGVGDPVCVRRRRERVEPVGRPRHDVRVVVDQDDLERGVARDAANDRGRRFGGGRRSSGDARRERVIQQPRAARILVALVRPVSRGFPEDDRLARGRRHAAAAAQDEPRRLDDDDVRPGVAFGLAAAHRPAHADPRSLHRPPVGEPVDAVQHGHRQSPRRRFRDGRVVGGAPVGEGLEAPKDDARPERVPDQRHGPRADLVARAQSVGERLAHAAGDPRVARSSVGGGDDAAAKVARAQRRLKNVRRLDGTLGRDDLCRGLLLLRTTTSSFVWWSIFGVVLLLGLRRRRQRDAQRAGGARLVLEPRLIADRARVLPELAMRDARDRPEPHAQRAHEVHREVQHLLLGRALQAPRSSDDGVLASTTRSRARRRQLVRRVSRRDARVDESSRKGRDARLGRPVLEDAPLSPVGGGGGREARARFGRGPRGGLLRDAVLARSE